MAHHQVWAELFQEILAAHSLHVLRIEKEISKARLFLLSKTPTLFLQRSYSCEALALY